MTTEEIKPLVRDVNVLLTLGTYQGMSDEEIELVIDFKINKALHDEEFKQTISAMKETQQAMQSAYAQLAQGSNDMLQSLLRKQSEGTANNE